MKRQLLKIYLLLTTFGLDPLKTIRSIKGLPNYFIDLLKLINQRRSDFDKSGLKIVEFHFGEPWFCFEDRFVESGQATGHYFHQDLHVARRIFLNDPDVHVDVGSRIDGFVAHVASFRPIEVFDLRPLSHNIPNIKFTQLNLMENIKDEMIGCCDSLSCLHALEHFGLGRYGDQVNYFGHIIGLNNLYKILKAGGKFFLSVPIGPQRIEFNAHRVFSVSYLLKLLAGKYQIDQFSFVDDKGDLHEEIPLDDADVTNNFECKYGCGIFEMTKL